MTQQLLCDQSTVARSTLQGIEKGSPGIAIGNYVKVLRVLGMENQLSRVGLPDSAWIKDLSDEVFRRGRFSSRN